MMPLRGVVGEVRGHDRGRAAVVGEGGLGHPCMTQRDEVREAVLLLRREDRDGVAVGRQVDGAVGAARGVLAGGAAGRDALIDGHPRPRRPGIRGRVARASRRPGARVWSIGVLAAWRPRVRVWGSRGRGAVGVVIGVTVAPPDSTWPRGRDATRGGRVGYATFKHDRRPSRAINSAGSWRLRGGDAERLRDRGDRRGGSTEARSMAMSVTLLMVVPWAAGKATARPQASRPTSVRAERETSAVVRSAPRDRGRGGQRRPIRVNGSGDLRADRPFSATTPSAEPFVLRSSAFEEGGAIHAGRDMRRR